MSLQLSASPIKIRNEQQLWNYLCENLNVYTHYIKQKLKRPPHLCPVPREKHHIIPKFQGGSNHRWNLIYLSVEEHNHAHLLRAQVYNQIGDVLCCRMRKNLTQYEQHLRIQLSHLSQQKTSTGFWNSELQRQNGRKGGKKQTPKKRAAFARQLHPLVRECFKHTMVWTHPECDSPIEIPANQIMLVRDIAHILRKKVRFNHAFTTTTSGLARVIKGELYTFKKWRLTFKI